MPSKFLLANANHDGREHVLVSAADFNWSQDQIPDREAAARTALRELEDEANKKEEEFRHIKERLDNYIDRIEDFANEDSSTTLPSLPSGSPSVADLFTAALKVRCANEAVEGGKVALAAIEKCDEEELRGSVDNFEEDDNEI